MKHLRKNSALLALVMITSMAATACTDENTDPAGTDTADATDTAGVVDTVDTAEPAGILLRS